MNNFPVRFETPAAVEYLEKTTELKRQRAT